MAVDNFQRANRSIQQCVSRMAEILNRQRMEHLIPINIPVENLSPFWNPDKK